MIAYFYAGFLAGLVVMLPVLFIIRIVWEERMAQIKMRLAKYGCEWPLWLKEDDR